MPQLLTEVNKSVARIRESIISGQYPLSSSLPQRKIAQEIGVSPIVVREAFRVLEKEGLVDIVPKWGARVASFQADKMKGVTIVREALEGMAARLLAARITGGDLAVLRRMAETTDSLSGDTTGDRLRFAKAHYALHSKIARLTNCPELYVALEKINLQYLIWLISKLISPFLARESGWHRKLVDTIGAREPDKAEAFMRRHVRRSLKDIQKSLEQRRDS